MDPGVDDLHGTVGLDLWRTVNGLDEERSLARLTCERYSALAGRVHAWGLATVGLVVLTLVAIAPSPATTLAVLLGVSIVAYALWRQWYLKRRDMAVASYRRASRRETIAGGEERNLARICDQVVLHALPSRVPRRQGVSTSDTSTEYHFVRQSNGRQERICLDKSMRQDLHGLLREEGLDLRGDDSQLMSFLASCALRTEFRSFSERLRKVMEEKGVDELSAFARLYGERRDEAEAYLPFLEFSVCGGESGVPEDKFEQRVARAAQGERVRRLREKVRRDGHIERNGIRIEDIDGMNCYKFEELIGLLNEQAGWMYKSTPRSGDQGADGILTRDGTRVVYQAKLERGPVGSVAVQQALTGRDYHSCDKGWVVTNSSGFTRDAEVLARKLRIRLVGRSEVIRWIDRFNRSDADEGTKARAKRLLEA